LSQGALRYVEPCGGLPYEKVGDASCLAYVCKSWYMLSLREFRTKQQIFLLQNKVADNPVYSILSGILNGSNKAPQWRYSTSPSL